MIWLEAAALFSLLICTLLSAFGLWIYRTCHRQLDHYHGALRENQRYLTAMELVDRPPHDQQDEMYREIIRGLIRRGS